MEIIFQKDNSEILRDNIISEHNTEIIQKYLRLFTGNILHIPANRDYLWKC